MKAKTYKPIPWDEATGEQRNLFNDVIKYSTYDVGPEQVKVYCGICSTTIILSCLREFYNSTISVEEQQHVDSDDHKQNVLMWKLGRNDAPEPQPE